MALIQINRDVSDPAGTLQPGELWLNLTNGRLWGGTSGGNALLLDPSGGTGPFLPLVGGTITGPLVLPGNATAPLQAMPLQQLDTAQHNIGRNLLHNPLFNVAQRGAGPWTAAGYTLDRWAMTIQVAGSASVARGSLTDANRAAIGDEAANYALSNAFTGSATSGAYISCAQAIEGVRRLAGKTVTISFWANAGAALKLGVNLLQSFGSGGSPSPAAWALATGLSVAIPGTNFARYSVTIPVPSVAGKTLGTAGDDFTQLAFWYSASGGPNAYAGNIGVQSGTINLWGVQLEIGSVATPLEKPDPRYDLANCQRFFWNSQVNFVGSAAAGASFGAVVKTPVTMRAAPTYATGIVTPSNATNLTAFFQSVDFLVLRAQATTAGDASMSVAFTLSADL